MKLVLDHVSLRVADLTRAAAFYSGVLGLAPHPERPNWFGVGQGCLIHLMTPTLDPQEREADGRPVDPARHVALSVASLEDIVALLLAHGQAPYQASVDQREFRAIATPEQPLDFGIGTVFVRDPDGNVIEFVEKRRGIFAAYDPS